MLKEQIETEKSKMVEYQVGMFASASRSNRFDIIWDHSAGKKCSARRRATKELKNQNNLRTGICIRVSFHRM